MPVNRFMKPAKQQVMSNYVPIPFDALAQAGAMTQQRYQQSMQVEQGIEDLLGSTKGISTVNTMSQGNVDAHGQERVDKEVGRFRERISKLQEGNPDFTSMEYMSGLKSTYNELKRSMNSGILGREAASYAALQEIYKQRSKNKDVNIDNSLALESDMQLLDYAGYGVDEMPTTLSQNVSFGEYVDLNKEMNVVLKDIKETLGREGFSGSGLEAYTKWTKDKGVSKNRVLQVAAERMQDPRIQNTIMKRAQWAAFKEGDTSKENLKKHTDKITQGLLESATNTFVRSSDIIRFLKTGDTSGSSAKKLADNLSRNVTMGVKGWGDFGIGSTMNKLNSFTTDMQDVQSAKKKKMRELGITDSGTNIDAQGIDRTRLMEYYDKQVESIQSMYDNLYGNVKEGMIVAGFSEDDIKEFDKLVGEVSNGSLNHEIDRLMAEDGLTKEEARLSAMMGKSGGSLGAGGLRGMHSKGSSDMAPSSTSNRLFALRNLVDNSSFKSYMKGKYGDRGIELNINNIDKSLKQLDMLKLDSFNQSFQNSIEDIKDATTGESWGSGDYKKFDPKGATLLGWSYDPNTGNPTLVYSVPSRKGEDVDGKIVKVEPPQGFESVLASSGQVGYMDNIINAQVMSTTKGIQTDNARKDGVTVSLGYKQIPEFNNKDLVSLQKTYDIETKDDLNLDVQILSPQQTGIPGEWHVVVPYVGTDGKKKTKVQPANSLGMASKISQNAYALYLETLKKK